DREQQEQGALDAPHSEAYRARPSRDGEAVQRRESGRQERQGDEGAAERIGGGERRLPDRARENGAPHAGDGKKRAGEAHVARHRVTTSAPYTTTAVPGGSSAAREIVTARTAEEASSKRAR